jgi:hypothetical protein
VVKGNVRRVVGQKRKGFGMGVTKTEGLPQTKTQIRSDEAATQSKDGGGATQSKDGAGGGASTGNAVLKERFRAEYAPGDFVIAKGRFGVVEGLELTFDTERGEPCLSYKVASLRDDGCPTTLWFSECDLSPCLLSQIPSSLQ